MESNQRKYWWRLFLVLSLVVGIISWLMYQGAGFTIKGDGKFSLFSVNVNLPAPVVTVVTPPQVACACEPKTVEEAKPSVSNEAKIAREKARQRALAKSREKKLASEKAVSKELPLAIAVEPSMPLAAAIEEVKAPSLQPAVNPPQKRSNVWRDVDL